MGMGMAYEGITKKSWGMKTKTKLITLVNRLTGKTINQLTIQPLCMPADKFWWQYIIFLNYTIVEKPEKSKLNI